MAKNTKEKRTNVKVRVTDKVKCHLVMDGIQYKPGDVVEIAMTDGNLERLGANPLLELVK